MRTLKLVEIIVSWIKANQVMLTNTLSLIGTTVVTSGMGFAYWWLAARQYSPETVGFGSATVSTMMLLSSIGMLGLGTLLITELPRQPGHEVSLISTGLVVVGVVGGVIGILFAIVAPDISIQFASLRASVLNVVIFAAGVSFSAITLVLDQALIGILEGKLQFWRNAIFAAAKLILLFVAGLYISQKTGMTVYSAWTMGMILSVAMLFIYTLFKNGWRGKAYLPRWDILRKLGRAALEHHMLNLIIMVPTQLLPVLVVMLLSAKMNAWFYVSWMLANFVFVIPTSLSMVLHAMNAAEQATLSQRARMTIALSFVACFMIVAVLYLETQPVLGVFGLGYVQNATWCLRILLLVAFPDIVKNHYISFCRIYDRIGQAMLGLLIGGTLELGGAVVGAQLGGLEGLCLGWLAASIIQGLYMSPLVYKMAWLRHSTAVASHMVNASAIPMQEALAAPVWLIDTFTLPAITPSQLALMRLPDEALTSNKPLWQAETMLLSVVRPPYPATTNALMEQGKPLWQANTLKLPIARVKQTLRRSELASMVPPEDERR